MIINFLSKPYFYLFYSVMFCCNGTVNEKYIKE